MTFAECVEILYRWERLEQDRSSAGDPRTGTFSIVPLPPWHPSGQYQVQATNTWCSRDGKGLTSEQDLQTPTPRR
jgi:hypothetical protein